MASPHRAGFVSILGKPNVGKSTLMNALVGENLSITTPKAQTTRHRIRGILSGDDFQIVYSDTPGLLEPGYALQRTMMDCVRAALEDADVLLWVVTPEDIYDAAWDYYMDRVKVPLLVALNQIDRVDEDVVSQRVYYWNARLNPAAIVATSALKRQYTDRLLEEIRAQLPVHPAYYPKDEITDRSERFLASEIIRKKAFMAYHKEVPYSIEVAIEAFEDGPDLIRMQAKLFVERASQKGIVIGRNGEALKKVATEARRALEAFFGKKVFLQTRVKVAPHWRHSKHSLKRFGYTH